MRLPKMYIFETRNVAGSQHGTTQYQLYEGYTHFSCFSSLKSLKIVPTYFSLKVYVLGIKELDYRGKCFYTDLIHLKSKVILFHKSISC